MFIQNERLVALDEEEGEGNEKWIYYSINNCAFLLGSVNYVMQI